MSKNKGALTKGFNDSNVIQYFGKINADQTQSTRFFFINVGSNIGKTFNFILGLAGFEPATYGLEDRYSIQLSYRPYRILV